MFFRSEDFLMASNTFFEEIICFIPQTSVCIDTSTLDSHLELVLSVYSPSENYKRRILSWARKQGNTCMGLMSDAFKNWFHGRVNWIKHFIHFVSYYFSYTRQHLSHSYLEFEWNDSIDFPLLSRDFIITKVTRFFLDFNFHCVYSKNGFFLKQCNEETNFKIQKLGSTAIVFQLSTGLSNVESMPLVWKVHYTWVHMISIWIFQFRFTVKQYPPLSIKRSSTYDGDWRLECQN